MKSETFIKKILLVGTLVISSFVIQAQPKDYEEQEKEDAKVPLDSEIVLPLVVASGAIAFILKRKNKKKE